MCEPTTLAVASLAIGAASTGYQYYTSNQQAQQARDQQTEVYNAQVQQQQIEFQRQAQDAALQYQRAMEQRNVQYAQLDKKTQEAASTASVRAAEGGVGGLSVDALMADYWRQELDSRLGLDMDAQNAYADYQSGQFRARNDYLTSSQNQYRNYQYGIATTQGMSPVTAGLGVASSAVNSASLYYSLKNPSVAPNRLPAKDKPAGV